MYCDPIHVNTHVGVYTHIFKVKEHHYNIISNLHYIHLPKLGTYPLHHFCQLWVTMLLRWLRLTSYVSRSRGDRWGATEDFAVIFLHPSLSSASLIVSSSPIPVHSRMLSSHLFFCLPLADGYPRLNTSGIVSVAICFWYFIFWPDYYIPLIKKSNQHDVPFFPQINGNAITAAFIPEDASDMPAEAFEFTVTDLTPGATYTFSVSASREGEGGEGPRGPESAPIVIPGWWALTFSILMSIIRFDAKFVISVGAGGGGGGWGFSFEVLPPPQFRILAQSLFMMKHYL